MYLVYLFFLTYCPYWGRVTRGRLLGINSIYTWELINDRPVQNPIFIQKSDNLQGQDNTVARIDPGVEMDTSAVFDPRIQTETAP